MKILAVLPPSGGGRELARADVEVMPGLRMFDLKIVGTDEGGSRVYGRSASFSPDVANQISAAVMSHKERVLNAYRH
jgi:hypothetical protein